MVVVEGTKVRLRPLDAADLPRVFEWYSDAELVAPYDRFFTDTYDSFARSVGEADSDALSLAPRFAVEPLRLPGAVGVVGHYVSHPVLQTVEVWYLIGDPSARGQGFGKEAVGLLVDHLFRTSSVERVGATCDVENLPSCRLVEGLGFRREGTLRQSLYHHGRWHDTYAYGVTRAERKVPSPPE